MSDAFCVQRLTPSDLSLLRSLNALFGAAFNEPASASESPVSE
jgi:hypothetical protein